SLSSSLKEDLNKNNSKGNISITRAQTVISKTETPLSFMNESRPTDREEERDRDRDMFITQNNAYINGFRTLKNGPERDQHAVTYLLLTVSRLLLIPTPFISLIFFYQSTP